jgi:hypothetical protein
MSEPEQKEMKTEKKRKSRFDNVEAVGEPEQKVQKPAHGGIVGMDASKAAERAAEMSRDLASKIAMVSSLLHTAPVKAEAQTAQTAYRSLVLDAQGREVTNLRLIHLIVCI